MNIKKVEMKEPVNAKTDYTWHGVPRSQPVTVDQTKATRPESE